MKKPIKIALSIVAVAIGIAAALASWILAGGLRPSPPPHQAFVGGSVLTMGADTLPKQAVLLAGDRIAAVGSDAEILAAAPPQTVITDLGGRTLMPGIIEAHGHFPGAGLDAIAVDLNAPPIGDVADMETLLTRLRLELEAKPDDDWIFGFGYDDTLLGEGRHPTRDDLDAVSKDRPIFILHVSGHMGVANSAALAAFDLDENSVDPDGGLIEREPNSRRPSGVLYETACEPLRERSVDVGFSDKRAALARALELYTQAGVTTAQNGLATETLIDGLVLGARIAAIPLRLVLWPDWDASEKLARDEMGVEEGAFLRLGATKLIADGSIQGYTAFLREPYYRAATHGPYANADWRGEPTLKRGVLIDRVTTLFGQGRQVAIHGNGDAAIDMILDAVEIARAAYPGEGRRTILIHAQTMRNDQIERARELEVTPSFFAAHIWYWGDRHRDVFLGPERAARISPLASADAAGLRYTTHLDTPVVPMDPWLSAAAAIERRTASGAVLGSAERISAERALRSMTIDAAWQVFREEDVGSIEVGKLADLIVLDRDPVASTTNLAEVKVLATIVGGVPIFEADGFAVSRPPNQ
ncbi:MAG: putative amidohydrolase YtcJ [Hyphomicrobiaceae bacterium]|jgi:predicted amidohydrolase YtcJ